MSVQVTRNDFYTYAYLSENGFPYYIGKGFGKRAYLRHHSVELPSRDRILILKKNLSEQEALDHERYMIHLFGRKIDGSGCLENRFKRGYAASITYERQDPGEWANCVLCALFGNKTAACVLLFIEENEEAHALRIAKTFGLGLNMVQRQLKKLEQNYVLSSRRVGSSRVYTFNHCNPIVKQLRVFLSACNSMPR